MTKHIVTTDDDAAIRKVLQIMLKKEGYQVSTCQNGTELLQLLNSGGYAVDLVLLDIKMPGMSGLEVLSLLQQERPQLPVVMLTAFNDLETGMKAIRMGASDYLAKPVSREGLVTCVQRVLKKAESKQQEVAQSSKYLEHQQELEGKLHDALNELKNVTRTTLQAFSETIEQKDSYTKGHCNRVRNISVAIGKALNFTSEHLQILEGGALLHDIGKIGISEQLLNKPTPLTKDEKKILQLHPVLGERIVTHIELFQPYRAIIRSHHELLDGTGYPDGLKGDDIPLDVRIVTLADAFDAMTSDRAYRAALPTEIAVEEIKLYSGTQFDPGLVDIFLDNEIFLL